MAKKTPAPLEFPREWFSFPDPEDDEHEFHCDLTWLMSSWTCVFGSTCKGILADRPNDGCCTHGAHFSDRADEKRVRAMAKELTADDWQHRKAGKADGIIEKEDGRKKTRVVDGACIFLNRPDFAAGPGCALHRMALRTDRHPLETKPDVCWQLPIWRNSEWVDRVDESRILVTTITEFNRRGWGEGGHDLDWWCSESPLAHLGGPLLYETYGPELTAMMGEPAYDVLRAYCDARRVAGGPAAVHPAEPVAP